MGHMLLWLLHTSITLTFHLLHIRALEDLIHLKQAQDAVTTVTEAQSCCIEFQREALDGQFTPLRVYSVMHHTHIWRGERLPVHASSKCPVSTNLVADQQSLYDAT